MSAVTKVQKFPWIVSRNSGNCWISEMRTIQPKILEIPGAKRKGKKTAGYPGYQRFFSRCSGNFFRRILRSEALVYKSFFFSEQPFYGNYSTLVSHTNTVISHGFAHSSRWRRKPWQGLLTIEEFTLIVTWWVIRARWREIRRFV